ncbi:pyridoxamine 5'-phosphate oxidase family protein [Pararhizobium antarcticum]|uniref:Flavin-nucleotide-binding protein n=1 Tax=Pararhizobium antarcticum TaxID=1798805 RepID=A0A657LX01_9HYPH|nr:pyridoxamine 5'-phosphate oxidase family protein [Pararhizobium antarcticum]OJF95669.1 flavin-nucleotide-binding protein [Rhizobium sp. 58]OJF99417.1 flavin-nucleotide-binding protein [Pararhizobium antarcticum]
MPVRNMREHECLEMLANRHLGYLACSKDDRPYIVPVHYAFEATRLYSFSMPGKKTEWLAANPHACLHVNDLERHNRWRSVLIEGQYTELPDTPEFHNERVYAWSLLQKHDLWWEPGMFKPSEAEDGGAEEPLFYSISVDAVSGRTLTDDDIE